MVVRKMVQRALLQRERRDRVFSDVEGVHSLQAFEPSAGARQVATLEIDDAGREAARTRR